MFVMQILFVCVFVCILSVLSRQRLNVGKVLCMYLLQSCLCV